MNTVDTQQGIEISVLNTTVLNTSSEITSDADVPSMEECIVIFLKGMIHNPQIKTPFTCAYQPHIDLVDFIERVIEWISKPEKNPLDVVTTHIATALILVNRLYKTLPGAFNQYSIYKIFFTAYVISDKMLHDRCYDYKYYASVGGVSTKDMSQMECFMLSSLKYKVFVTIETINQAMTVLESIRDSAERV